MSEPPPISLKRELEFEVAEEPRSFKATKLVEESTVTVKPPSVKRDENEVIVIDSDSYDNAAFIKSIKGPTTDNLKPNTDRMLFPSLEHSQTVVKRERLDFRSSTGSNSTKLGTTPSGTFNRNGTFKPNPTPAATVPASVPEFLPPPAEWPIVPNCPVLFTAKLSFDRKYPLPEIAAKVVPSQPSLPPISLGYIPKIVGHKTNSAQQNLCTQDSSSSEQSNLPSALEYETNNLFEFGDEEPLVVLRFVVSKAELEKISGGDGSGILALHADYGIHYRLHSTGPNDVDRELELKGALDAVCQAISSIAESLSAISEWRQSIEKPVVLRMLVPNLMIPHIVGADDWKINKIRNVSCVDVSIGRISVGESSDKVFYMLGRKDELHVACYYIGFLLNQNMDEIKRVGMFYVPIEQDWDVKVKRRGRAAGGSSSV
ncbi:UNVERIFIED_CONTAM: hypothetical protein HDU68_000764 [Siphonaria sp. JEL0065]|nr:hypothetical protein HDU68_000764 [Siphonaria sp. JEL0065]